MWSSSVGQLTTTAIREDSNSVALSEMTYTHNPAFVSSHLLGGLFSPLALLPFFFICHYHHPSTAPLPINDYLNELIKKENVSSLPIQEAHFSGQMHDVHSHVILYSFQTYTDMVAKVFQAVHR